MNVPHYNDIDYSIDVSEDVYIALREDLHRLTMFGNNGLGAFIHEIERAHFRYVNFGRKPELEIEIVARTQIAEEGV